MAGLFPLSLVDKVALSMEGESNDNILCMDSQSWFVFKILYYRSITVVEI